ncbi:D-arabinono-1,4-lactone oxidase [Rhodococcus tukisamuensis]|uniref:L-gulonolactone oxidase n=1 Tax=Rhodococcus tukisamuensis TaxID=168276 RepID=A0A1G7CIT0_9NOCA|nr:D-arabinono-1,4-lactone oxidase [Rhodococcus tukisamuensis]SDE39153.1 L-gulonolactone oxidase [Rhodococcus tukisamuensis]
MDQQTWHNWAECASASPRRYATPASVAELSFEIARATTEGLHVKCVGAGHSFTPVAVTDGVLISLDNLSGIKSVVHTEPAGALVTVLAGTRLRDLNPMLWDLGLAMTNLGDIDAQSIAGAIATGTHGTGARFGGLATQVRALTLVLADGTVVECSPEENSELFEAARIGLGAVGVIATLTLQCEPAYAMRAVESPDRLSAVMERIDENSRGVDHFEFYWFPHTDRVLTKRNTRLPATTPLEPVGRVRGFVDDELLSNTFFEGVNRVAAQFPAAIPKINEVASRALSAREFTDRSYRVFASSRRVKFREMEYAVPVEALPDTLREIDQWLGRSDFRVAFPVEVRFAAADDVWMSTAHGRDTAYVAVHQYYRRDHRPYFDAVESIARAADGRPHWGKLHSRTAADLRPTYQRFDEFCSVRDKYDPSRVFDNDYLRQVLG